MTDLELEQTERLITALERIANALDRALFYYTSPRTYSSKDGEPVVSPETS